MVHKCSFPDGVEIKPDGVNALDPCLYVRKETHKNVTVYIDQCSKCGHVIISWGHQPNTESTIYGELVEDPTADNFIQQVFEIEELEEEDID